MLLSQKEAQKLLKKYNLAAPKTFLTESSLEDCKLSYPVVLKVDSPHIVHKSDGGYVVTGIKDKKHLQTEMKQMQKKLKDIEHSFIIQEMLKGVEVLVGMKRDETFGPVIVFGLGGVFVELMHDVSMRIAPLKREDCLSMLDEIKGKALLHGYRGSDPIDQDSLIELLLSVSKLAQHEKDIFELDFNPVILTKDKAYVADARFINA